MKITGRVGIFKVKETHKILNLILEKDELIACGIVGSPGVMGGIFKGWHKVKEETIAFNNRDSFLGRNYFAHFCYNQNLLDWEKLEYSVD